MTMKRFITAILSTFACLCLDAQVSPDRVLSFPAEYSLYHDSEYYSTYTKISGLQRKFSNIDFEKFFAEWEAYSELVAKGAVVNEYNEIFRKHFCEEYTQAKEESKYLTLPLYVKVIKYDCNIDLDSDKILDPDSLKHNIRPEYIRYFTPAIKSDKKVLYMLPEVESMLADYIEEGREDSVEEMRKRKGMIGEYVSTTVGHWNLGWYFLSYPNIYEIVITNNGYYIELVDANYYGQVFFVPWNKEPMMLYYWIQ